MSAVANSSYRTERVVPVSKLWWVALVAAAGSALANLIFWLITRAVGISYVIPLGGPGSPLEPLPAAPVIIASALPALVAAVLLALLGRFVARPVRIFWIISIVFLVLSFAMPFTLPAEVAFSTKIALNVMHVISGAVIVGVLTTLGRE